MNNILRFTIAIPVTKPQYFGKTLQSALSQVYNNYEVIILNNASNIQTKTEIKKIVKSFNDNKIRYYENDYQIPIVRNWNKCLELSKGEYFHLLSDDDLIEKEFLEKMDEKIDKYPDVSIFHCRTKIIDENGQLIRFAPSCPEWESCVDFIWHRFNEYRIHMLSDFIAKTDELKKISGFVDFPLAFGSDDATWFKLAEVNGIVYCQDTLFNYRNSNSTYSNNYNLENALMSTVMFSKWAIEFINKLSTVDREDGLKLLNLKVDADTHFSKTKATVFIKYYGDNINCIKLLNAVKSLIMYRKIYSISVKTSLFTMVFLIKNYVFRKKI